MLRMIAILTIVCLIGCGKSAAVTAASLSSAISSSSVVQLSSSSVSPVTAWFSQTRPFSTDTITIRYNIRNDADSNFIYVNSINCTLRTIYGKPINTITLKNEYADTNLFIFPHKVMTGTVTMLADSIEVPRSASFLLDVVEFNDTHVEHILNVQL